MSIGKHYDLLRLGTVRRVTVQFDGHLVGNLILPVRHQRSRYLRIAP